MGRLAFLVVLMVAGTALAAGDRMEVKGGHELARAWCAGCHAVERGESRGPEPDAPSFANVASLPSSTTTALHAFLSSPHAGMPDIKMSSSQMDELVDYILSLRDE